MKNQSPPNRGWVPGLDSIRFVLALIVVLGHSNPGAAIQGILPNHLASRLLAGVVGNTFVGAAAVVAFFIISGFVIHFPYRHGKALNLPDYFAKRYVRIGVPMIAVALIATLWYGSISILPFWSLYCELIYYTLYPALLLVVRKYRINNTTLVGLAYVVSISVLFYTWKDINVFLNQSKAQTTNFHWLGIYGTWLLGLPFWLLGVGLANRYDALRSQPASLSKLNFIRVVTLGCAFLCSVSRFHFSLSYTLSFGPFGLLAAYWLANEIRYWADRPPLLFLETAGKWSYSLYLCHLLWIGYLEQNTASSSPLVLVMKVAGSLLFSYLFYRLLEKPSHQLAKKIRIPFGLKRRVPAAIQK